MLELPHNVLDLYFFMYVIMSYQNLKGVIKNEKSSKNVNVGFNGFGGI